MSNALSRSATCFVLVASEVEPADHLQLAVCQLGGDGGANRQTRTRLGSACLKERGFGPNEMPP